MKKSIMARKAESRFCLMVSIPENKPEMARAAQKGGADGIKMHLNVNHYASGTSYGTWQQEKQAVQNVIDAVNIPVGILPGAAGIYADYEEIMEAKAMGIDFMDSFAHDFPVYLFEDKDLGMMVAVNGDYDEQMLRGIELAGADMIEATLLTHDNYGKRLDVRDLALYNRLSGWTSRPVIVPTQKKIMPEEVAWLRKAGASGIVIGAVVTGNTPEGVFEATSKFRNAIKRFDG